jgi:D-3-phosphoglycerate dehydrogenase
LEGKLISEISDRDLMIFRSGVNISEQVMKAESKVKFLIRAGSCLDNLDKDFVLPPKTKVSWY